MKAPKTAKVMDLSVGDGDHLIVICDKSKPVTKYRLYRTYFEHGSKHRVLIDSFLLRYDAVSSACKWLYFHSHQYQMLQEVTHETERPEEG